MKSNTCQTGGCCVQSQSSNSGSSSLQEHPFPQALMESPSEDGYQQVLLHHAPLRDPASRPPKRHAPASAQCQTTTATASRANYMGEFQDIWKSKSWQGNREGTGKGADGTEALQTLPWRLSSHASPPFCAGRAPSPSRVGP